MNSIIKYIAPFVLFVLASLSVQAQQEKDTTMIVNGVCNMCKMTIENAADVKGVSLVKWSPETKVLQLRYEPSRISLMEISEAINKSGYDTEYNTADDEAYHGLHKCCHYRDPEVIKSHQNK